MKSGEMNFNRPKTLVSFVTEKGSGSPSYLACLLLCGFRGAGHADAEGYRSSLMERGSHGVGYEYYLVPVGLRNGVFHPKCCYLVGPESDLFVG